MNPFSWMYEYWKAKSKKVTTEALRDGSAEAFQEFFSKIEGVEVDDLPAISDKKRSKSN